MLEDNLHQSDGLHYIGEAMPQCRVLFAVGPVRLRFSIHEFYDFAVLVLDAEAAFETRFCQHGNALTPSAADGQEFVLNQVLGAGKVFECGACSYIHVDAFDQRIVVAPNCFRYLLSLLRRCAAEMEQRISKGIPE